MHAVGTEWVMSGFTEARRDPFQYTAFIVHAVGTEWVMSGFTEDERPREKYQLVMFFIEIINKFPPPANVHKNAQQSKG